jgi:hypothetical protein
MIGMERPSGATILTKAMITMAVGHIVFFSLLISQTFRKFFRQRRYSSKPGEKPEEVGVF